MRYLAFQNKIKISITKEEKENSSFDYNNISKRKARGFLKRTGPT